MIRKVIKFISLFLCFLLILEQSGFAQVVAQLDIAGHLAGMRNALTVDKFRPLHLRYLQYLPEQNNFRLLLDKGDAYSSSLRGTASEAKQDEAISEETKTLLKYFFIGLSLPNDSFWVNLRPDSPDNIIDPLLAQTDVGRILLEADLQLKKDTSRFTSPETPEGREYWDKLYKKAGEIFGNRNVTIPTLTRPWIVPDEIIIRETTDSAYIYKATLKVMLEQDYLKGSAVYNFKDDRLKELNEYSSQLIRELIIPKLTKEINTSKRYAPLRQVYYSLILASWFKARNQNKNHPYARIIDRKDLTSLISKEFLSQDAYFNAYKENFAKGEYNIQEPAYTPYGQTIRSYFSGGIELMQGQINGVGDIIPKGQPFPFPASSKIEPKINEIMVQVKATDEPGKVKIAGSSITEESVQHKETLKKIISEHDLRWETGLRLIEADVTKGRLTEVAIEGNSGRIVYDNSTYHLQWIPDKGYYLIVTGGIPTSGSSAQGDRRDGAGKETGQKFPLQVNAYDAVQSIINTMKNYEPLTFSQRTQDRLMGSNVPNSHFVFSGTKIAVRTKLLDSASRQELIIQGIDENGAPLKDVLGESFDVWYWEVNGEGNVQEMEQVIRQMGVRCQYRRSDDEVDFAVFREGDVPEIANKYGVKKLRRQQETEAFLFRATISKNGTLVCEYDYGNQFYINGRNIFSAVSLQDILKQIATNMKPFVQNPELHPSLATIEKSLKPGRMSEAGFLAENEHLWDIIEQDNRILAQFGVTHKQIADILNQIFDETKEGEKIITINNVSLRVVYGQTRGTQDCPWRLLDDWHEYTTGSPESKRYDSKEQNFGYLGNKYIKRGSRNYVITNLNIQKSIELSDMAAHLIGDHHFFEGSTSYRIDPLKLMRVLGISGSERQDKQGPSQPLPIYPDRQGNTFGGIDFRSLPIVTQAIGNLRMNMDMQAINRLRSCDVRRELQDIQREIGAGISPSAKRIKEYVRASSIQGNLDIDKVVSCISDILRYEEETCRQTEPVLRDILVVLESSRSNQELSEVFIGKI